MRTASGSCGAQVRGHCAELKTRVAGKVGFWNGGSVSLLRRVEMSIEDKIQEEGVKIIAKGVSTMLHPIFQAVGGDLLEVYNAGTERLKDRLVLKLRGETIRPDWDRRAVSSILMDGGLANDDLVEEYFAGLLAGTLEGSDDDAALPYCALMRGLKKVHVRLHYIVCHALNTIRPTLDLNPGKVTFWLEEMRGLFGKEMVFELQQLERAGLLRLENMPHGYFHEHELYISISVTELGVRLYCAAFNRLDEPAAFNKEYFGSVPGIPRPQAANDATALMIMKDDPQELSKLEPGRVPRD